MSRPAARRALATAIVVPALALAACGDGNPPEAAGPSTTTSTSSAGETSTPSTSAPPDSGLRTIAVAVEGGSTVGGSRTETVRLGEQVRIEVTADVVDEVHVHTYDVLADVTPEVPAVIELTADIPGVHEVELENSHLLLFELQVEP